MNNSGGFIERGRAWWLYAIMALATLIACFQQAGLATVSGDIAATLRVEPASLGLLTAAFFYAYAAMQLPAGLLSDSLGPRKSVSAALGLAAVGTLIFAQAETLFGASLGRAVMGAGLAVVVAPQLKLIAVWFPARSFSRLTAIAFAITSLGPLMATSPMAYASAACGWRAPFLFLAAFTLVCAVLVWLIVRDAPPANLGSKLDAPDLTLADMAALAVKNRKPNAPESGLSLRQKLGTLLKNRAVWRLGLWQGCQGGAYFAFLGLWGGQYLSQGLGLEAQEVGWILIPAACCLLIGPLVSLLAEKISNRRTMLLMSACSAVLMLPICLGLPWFSQLPSAVLSGYFLLYSIACIAPSAMMFSAAKNLFDVSLAGTASGFINMFAFAGGALMQQIMGLVVEKSLAGGAGVYAAQSRAYFVFLAAGLFSLLLALRHKDPAPGGPLQA